MQGEQYDSVIEIEDQSVETKFGGRGEGQPWYVSFVSGDAEESATKCNDLAVFDGELAPEQGVARCRFNQLDLELGGESGSETAGTRMRGEPKDLQGEDFAVERESGSAGSTILHRCTWLGSWKFDDRLQGPSTRIFREDRSTERSHAHSTGEGWYGEESDHVRGRGQREDRRTRNRGSFMRDGEAL